MWDGLGVWFYGTTSEFCVQRRVRAAERVVLPSFYLDVFVSR